MNFNNKGTYAVVGIAVFIISKIILGSLGIENVPVPIIIVALVASYAMFLIGISSKKLIGGERTCYIVSAILLAVFLLTTIIIYIFVSYFSQNIKEYKIFLIVILAINILSLLGLTIAGMIIKKKYQN